MSKVKFYKLYPEIAERTDISSTSKLVYSIIRNSVGSNGIAWPGQRSIARKCGTGKTTVKECIEQLEKVGLIQSEDRGKGRTKFYKLCSESGTETDHLTDEKCTGNRPPVVRKPTTSVPETDRIKNKRKEPLKRTIGKRGFTPPTPNQVYDYAKSIDFKLQGEKFCDYYLAQGWKLANGQPMKDWRAAVRNWQRTEKKNGDDRRAIKTSHGKPKAASKEHGGSATGEALDRLSEAVQM